MAPGELDNIIGKLDCSDENLIVGIEGSEDATVYQIDEHRAIVQTVDFITPVVDDPYLYGQIAAANSLSDIFAMGADVLTAMNVVCFDNCNLSNKILDEILAGGQNKIAECGGVIAGGHTVGALEMLYGLSVTGMVHPARIYRNNTPREGDLLILTKPLGMGVLTTAIKADMLENNEIVQIATIMAQLNQKASQVMRDYEVHACTDITGFGLAGHACEMSAGNFTLSFDYDAIPILPNAFIMAEQGVIPGGSHKNKSYLKPKTNVAVSDKDDILFYDAQTSGGLLMAVAPEDADDLRMRLVDEGYSYSSIIGEVLPLGDYELVLK